MTPDRWATLQTLLLEALDLPEAGRTALLDRHAGTALGAELGALLAAADAVPAFLDAPAPWSLAAAPEPADLAGTEIGPYRIVRELGRGGQGRVFLATRADLGTTVALKLVRGGLAAPDVVGRFLTERRVLAGLAHPHIARLLDAGTARTGADETPYFVMEAVEGEPITDYVAGHAVPLAERLRLFAQVCGAVAFAHRRLVVHRDLKPSNIFVTAGPDGRPTVKLLDFGIAKLLADDADSLDTRTGHRLLTPAYAAPEQVTGEPVTVATDVYALGVLLYELLADVRPYDVSGGMRAIVRAVCDEEPARPSSRVPPDRARRLRGDLDTIALKALAKTPADRYASAEALGADVERHGVGLPVLARPQTARYRAARFARRHRVWVGVAVLAVGTLAALGVRERTVRADAEHARDEAQATADLLLDVFGASSDGDGAEIRPDTLRAELLVDRAARRLDARIADQPRLKAALTLHVGDLYEGLLLPVKSQPRFVAAEALARDALARGDGAATDVLAEALMKVGMGLARSGYCQEALPRLDEAVRRRAEARADPLAMAQTRENRAAVYACLGRYAEAVAEARAAQAVFGARPDDRGFTLHSLADYLERAGHPQAALDTLRASIARAEALYPRGHTVPTARRNLLSFYLARGGDLAEAERVARRSFHDARSRHPASHNRTMGAQIQLARVLRQAGRLAEAEAQTADLVGIARTLPPSDAVVTGRVFGLHAQVLLDAGRPAEAEAAIREALAIPIDEASGYLGDRVVQHRVLRDALAAQGRPGAAAHAERAAEAVEREIEARRTGG